MEKLRSNTSEDIAALRETDNILINRLDKIEKKNKYRYFL